MYFGWEHGWDNSFHKGYEQHFVGLLTSLLGISLLVLSLFYVPMAQVHQAVTGEARAFFDFRFVWRLIQARLTANCAAAALIVLIAVPLQMLKSIPGVIGNNEELTDAEVLLYLRQYLFASCLLLLPTVLLARRVVARVYRSAVLKVLRQGLVPPGDVHPKLAGWLDQLGLMPAPQPRPTGLGWAVVAGTRWGYRRLLYAVLLFIWLVFVAQTYVGEFFQRHPGSGFLNHVLIQLPSFDFVPKGLTGD
jgi:hypothetical protein